MKKKTISQLKRRLDKIFSEYIRRRDSDPDGYCYCVTCRRRMHWKEAHAGHFQSRAKLSTRFHERNLAAQCCSCNSFHAGQQYAFGKAIDFKYGEGEADRLENLPKDGFKISTHEYELMITDYKARILLQREVMGEN